MEELLIERLKVNFAVIKKAIKAGGIKGACYDECMKAMVSIMNEALLLDMWYYGLDDHYKASCLILDQRFIWGEMSKKTRESTYSMAPRSCRARYKKRWGISG